MKKSLFFFSLSFLFFTVLIQAQDISYNTNPVAKTFGQLPIMDGSAVTITHSTSQTIITGNSVSCNLSGLHSNNSYFRAFTLTNFGITEDFNISMVEIGVEQATGAGGTQPITVYLYTSSSAFPIGWPGSLTQIGTANINVPDQALTIFQIPVTGTAPAGSQLVVEIFTPDGQTAGNSFFIGSNNLGETGPSYLLAADCGVTVPTPTGSIGFPDMQIVMNVTGETGGGGCNGVIFSDDFESGTGQWTLQGAWGLATNQSHSPTNSLSESPSGNYPPNLNISATMTSGVDLSSALGAELKFWAKYDIEQGFDYMYLEVTTNGTTWVQLEAFNAEGVPWTEFIYDLSGFVGNSDVKVRFRFFSDGGYEVDGMYIDDLEISCSDADLSAPLIVHTGPEFYQGTPDPFDVVADITDISGVASAEVQYTVDGGGVQTVGPSNISGSTYTFTIPAQLAGSWVDYSIIATDNLNNSTIDPPVFNYISGTYVGYDNPEVSFYVPFAVGTGAAVRMTAPAGDNILVTALIRNYTDINNPNNDMLFHVWSNVGGLPGTDLITPFLVTPEATLQNTSAMTRIDLRPYLAQLSNLTGDFHVGFTVPSGIVNITEYSPAVANRSANYTTSWSLAAADYHFRVIMGNPSNIPVELTSFAASVTNGGNVVLNWSTATETNNHMFEIERRAPQAEYFTIGFVNGAGTTTEPQNYSYTDQTVENGVYFYRLKQLDFDGSYAYSDEVEVDVKGPLTFNLVQNYPNPFNPSTSINYSIPEAGNIRLSVYNVVGEEVAILIDGFSQAGFFEVSFNASNLPSGVYMYKLQSANSVQTKKMMLLK